MFEATAEMIYFQLNEQRTSVKTSERKKGSKY